MLSDLDRIDNMLLSINRIKEIVKDLNEEQFLNSWQIQDLCRFHFTIIGEDAKRLSDSIKETQPHIPWRSISAMRNIIIHDYMQADYHVIWQATQDGLLVLEKALLTMKTR